MLETRPRKWIKYSFKTKEIEDPRPLKFNKSYPWWLDYQSTCWTSIVMWLPETEKLTHYYDDAYDITTTISDNIVYTNRHPKPSWID
jgi:hypothetical protein